MYCVSITVEFTVRKVLSMVLSVIGALIVAIVGEYHEIAVRIQGLTGYGKNVLCL